jgi:hypothetical protein
MVMIFGGVAKVAIAGHRGGCSSDLEARVKPAAEQAEEDDEIDLNPPGLS